MSTKPVIFISAVSRELHSARDLVAKILLSIGYEPTWQDLFGTEQGDIGEMLRRKIDEADGVVQLIGQCYGFAPPQPDAEFGRVSYTQYEACYARHCRKKFWPRRKKVWYILLDETFPADKHDPEPCELSQLQSAYRQRVLRDTHLYYRAKDNTELELRIRKLRRWRSKWAILVISLLLLLVAGGVWFNYRQGDQTDSIAVIKDGQSNQTAAIAAIKSQNDKLLAAMRELSPTLGQVSQAWEEKSESARLVCAYDVLEGKLKLPRGTLAKELPKFAKQLLQRSDTSVMDRSSAHFVQKEFGLAEAAALEAKDKAVAAGGQPVKDAIAALELAGSAAEKQTHYADALAHYRAAAALTSQKTDPIEWARVQNSIAYVLDDQRDGRQAAEVLRSVITTLERELGPKHPDTLGSRAGLAEALRAQGKNAEAEKENRAVLAIRESVLGPKHPDTLGTRNNLAAALQAQGKTAEAEAEYRAVLAIRESVLGPKHPDTLRTRNNLAITLYDQGKYAEVEKEHRARIAIEERVLGKEHPDTLGSRNNLGYTLNVQGKSAEAEAEHRAVLAIRVRVLGSKHPDTLNTRNNLGEALNSQRKYGAAEKEHRAVLLLREDVEGLEHPQVFESCFNLAVCLQAQGKKEEAFSFAERASEGYRKALGEEHPDTKRAKELLEGLEKAQ